MEEVWNGSSSLVTPCWSSTVSTTRSSSSLQISSLQIHGQIQLQLQPLDPRPPTPGPKLEEARTAGTGISLSLSLTNSVLTLNIYFVWCSKCWPCGVLVSGSGPCEVVLDWSLISDFFFFFLNRTGQ